MDQICGNCVYYRAIDIEHGYCIMEEKNTTQHHQACYDTIIHGRFKSDAKPVKEPEPQKAYVIVCGEYSDYEVCGVFLNKEEAERAVEIANRKSTWYKDHRILEFYIGVPKNFENCRLYTVWIDKEGHVIEATMNSWMFTEDLNTVLQLTGNFRRSEYRIRVYATDEEYAKKIASDIFAKWKAEKEGIT